MAEIGVLIKEFRKKNHISQEAFGKRLGVNKQTVSKWENGIQVPAAEKYYEIAQIIGVPYSSLLSTDTESGKAAPFVFQKRIRYNVGLNALYESVHDFRSFGMFIDAVSAAKDVVSRDEPVIGYMLVNQTIEEEETGIPILSMEYDTYAVTIKIPGEDELSLFEETVGEIHQASSFNNEAYSFIVHLKKPGYDECDDFLQFVIGFRTDNLEDEKE